MSETPLCSHGGQAFVYDAPNLVYLCQLCGFKIHLKVLIDELREAVQGGPDYVTPDMLIDAADALEAFAVASIGVSE